MMGEADDTIFVTGCPSIDIARSVLADSSWMTTSYLYDRYAGTGARVDIENRFIVVAQHPVTTEFEDAYEQMWTTLLAVEKTGMPSLVFWPNADAGSEATAKAIRVFREQHNPDNMCFFRNLSPEDFLALLLRCACIVGNSSAGIRECAYLGVPAVNIGSRQEGRERGPNVLDVGYNIDEIVSAVQHQATRRYPQSTIYGAGDAGMRIAEILAATSPRIEKKFVDRSMP